jgi:hypothetical protein
MRALRIPTDNMCHRVNNDDLAGPARTAKKARRAAGLRGTTGVSVSDAS